MAWRLNNLQVVIGSGQSQRWTFSWGGSDQGAQYFCAHPLIVGNELVLSEQTKATVPAVGGGIFYAVTVTNVSPRPGQFTWEGGGFT